MGGSPTAPKVLEVFLAAKPGRLVTLAELVAETGLTADQVQGAVVNLRNREGIPIEIVHRGQIWKYDPTVLTGKRMFEEIGPAKVGVIVQDEDGKLYRLEEL